VNPTLELVEDRLTPSITRYAEVMGRTLADTIKRAARGVTRRVVAITPPGSAGVAGAAAYRQGRAKIKSQMNQILAPVRLKGQRRITVVFGRTLKRPFTVPTKERFPDVAAIYRQRTSARKNGVGIRASRGAKAFVDVRKFNAILKAKEGRVGLLASGWAGAAAALDVPMQQWISRHGAGRGSIKQDFYGSRMHITVHNFAAGAPANVTAELSRRIAAALVYQREAMGREISHMVFKKAQEHAIQTRNFSGLVPAGMMGGEAA